MIRLISLILTFNIVCFNAQVVKIFCEKDSEYQDENTSYKSITRYQELAIDSKVRLNSEDSYLVFYINGKQYKTEGVQHPTTFIEIINHISENRTQNHETSVFANISNFIFGDSDDNRPAAKSSVDRGDGRNAFYDWKYNNGNMILAYEGHNNSIVWQSTKNNTNYRLNISCVDEQLDTIITVKDTSCIIESTIIDRCKPCNVSMLEPENIYDDIILFSTTINEDLELFESVLYEANKNNTIFQLSFIDMLVSKGYISTAYYYHNYFLNKNEDKMLDAEFSKFKERYYTFVENK